MLALAVALRERGHEPVLAATPLFAPEARDFGLPFVPVGLDVQQFLREHREELGSHFSLRAVRLMNQVIVKELRLQLDGLMPLARDFECVVAGGAVMAARTAAEAAGVPYHYIAYTPQILPSAYHVPIMLPLTRTPRWFNRLAWRGMRWFYDPLVLRQLNERRQPLGLAPVKDSVTHLFPAEHALVAADPELFPLPPDISSPQVGAFCLADERPLPQELERFLAAGEPPVYIGFGSMPDATPERTTRLIAEAARRVGCRVVLSSGWAELGASDLGPGFLTVGPLSHWRLFPRLAAAVHHGGAGTTAAATRAGVPQVVVPHAFDQFLLAHRVKQANLGVVVPRSRLTLERLTEALGRILRDTSMREAAVQVGERIRQRDALETAIQYITAGRDPTARARPVAHG
jgi:vancomycin aglycone glucosyltransferase